MANEIILDEQQRAAVAVRNNVVVSAGAGSGKTRVLTERYLDMVRSGVDVSEILTLTFTRKAAAEMFQRIYRRLSEVADEGSHLSNQLQRFDEAQISTLDSFCAGILRDSTTRFGLPPQIQSDEVQLRREAEQLALQFITRHGDDPVVGAYARQLGVERTLSEFLVPLATRFFRLSAPIDFEDLFQRQLRWLEERRLGVEQEITAAVKALTGVAGDKGNAKEVCAALNDAGTDYAALADIMETVDRRRFPRGDAGAPFKEVANTLLEKNGRSRAGLLPRWTALQDTARRADELEHLYRVLAPFQEEVLARRRSRGLLSHHEVMELAVTALREDSDLRQAYKERFRYIMIDEFQDNNAVQRDLLFLLSEDLSRSGDQVPAAEELQHDKLFFVGDQKQSIYRFRGADVAVFRRLSRDIAGLLTLDTNYRSEPLLIRFFNALFPRVFGEPQHDWDAEFEPLHHRAPDAAKQPAITVAWVTEPEKSGLSAPSAPSAPSGTGDSNDEPADLSYSEAGWIAAEIRRLTVTERRYAPGDIAILYRTSGNQQKLERMLRREGIPYRTQAVRSLFTEAPAADLYALLQLCFYPSDRGAFAAFLRSPFVMLSDSAMARILTEEVPAGEELLPVSGRRGVQEISAQDVDKLDHADRLYERVARKIDRTPLYEVVRGIWEEEGYRYAILHRASDHPYLEHLAYLNALALRYSDRPAIEFVDYLRDQLGETEKVDELELPGGDDAVQLMTIHKSKGLEFPVVFVSGMGGGVGNHQQIVRYDGELGLTVRLPDREPTGGGSNVFEEHARREEELQEAAELRRILYVAMTRAEQVLYLTAAVGRRTARRPMLDLFCTASGFDPMEGVIAAELESLVSLERMPVLTERDLREHAVPQTAQRVHLDAAAVAEHATTVEFLTAIAEITPSEINRLVQERDSASRGSQVVGSAAPSAAAATALPDDDEGGWGTGDASLLGTLTHALLERAVPIAASGTPSREPHVAREEWRSFPPWAERAVGPAMAQQVGRETLDE
ncbi:MAG TPA: UvrD-helicase domain-containing protein, partial [Alkalispirochaeta sp.]|nr:UvrD-helicase domain-containing protein [Alkalispirochaeta sp.]